MAWILEGQFEDHVEHFGTIFKSILGPFWDHVEHFWTILGTILGPFWCKWEAVPAARLRTSDRSWDAWDPARQFY